MSEQSCTGAVTDIKHRELWASLSLVANIGNEDQGEPLHGGVHSQEAGVLHGDGYVDGQRDDGDPERRCHRDKEHRDGVLGGGEGGDADGQPAGDDGCGEVQGPGGGHSLLVVTGKRRGRPRRNIVPDVLVKLWIRKIVNIISKNQNINSGQAGCSQVGVGVATF
jgi:hypothetical protein